MCCIEKFFKKKLEKKKQTEISYSMPSLYPFSKFPSIVRKSEIRNRRNFCLCNPQSVKILLVESGILGFRIQIRAQGIRNPTFERLGSGIEVPLVKNRIQVLESLIWGETFRSLIFPYSFHGLTWLGVKPLSVIYWNGLFA